MSQLLDNDFDLFFAKRQRKSAPQEITELGNGAYVVEQHVGTGGMGSVYEAREPSLKKSRRVAIKVIKHGMAAHAHYQERFREEASRASQVDHEGIVKVITFGEEGGRLYLVMEWMEGGSLDKHLKPGSPLKVDDAVRIGRQIISAIATLHEEQIVHRDIKPANILLTKKGQAKVTDFGLARVVGDLVGISHGSGTYGYRSPEQRKPHQEVGAPSDVFSFGILFHQLLTGHRGFLETEQDRLDFPRNVPQELRKICGESTRWEPKDRLKAEEVLERLTRFQRKRRTARYRYAMAILIPLLFIAFGGVYYFRSGMQEQKIVADEAITQKIIEQERANKEEKQKKEAIEKLKYSILASDLQFTNNFAEHVQFVRDLQWLPDSPKRTNRIEKWKNEIEKLREKRQQRNLPKNIEQIWGVVEARYYVMLGQYDEGFSTGKSYATKSINLKIKALALHVCADALLGKKNYPQAAAYYEKVIALSDQFKKLNISLWPTNLKVGVCYMKMEEYSKANLRFSALVEDSDVDKIAEDNSEEVEHWLGQGYLLRGLIACISPYGDCKQAAIDLDAAKKIFKDTNEIEFIRSCAVRILAVNGEDKINEINIVMAFCEERLANQETRWLPLYVDCLFNRAMCRTEIALQAYEKGQRIVVKQESKKAEEDGNTIVETLKEYEVTEQLELRVRGSTAIGWANSFPPLTLAKVDKAIRYFDKALPDLRKLVEKDKDISRFLYRESLRHLGMVLFRKSLMLFVTKKYQQTIDVLDEAIPILAELKNDSIKNMDQRLVFSYYNRGQAHGREQNWENACVDLIQAANGYRWLESKGDKKYTDKRINTWMWLRECAMSLENNDRLAFEVYSNLVGTGAELEYTGEIPSLAPYRQKMIIAFANNLRQETQESTIRVYRGLRSFLRLFGITKNVACCGCSVRTCVV